MTITLIGMPGVGKTFFGKKLAERLGYRFLDVDKLIEKASGHPLQTIINRFGESTFSAIEEKTVLGLQNLDQTVIAPGGSVIYSNRAMEFLKRCSRIVFLDAPLAFLEHRLDNRDTRGIIGLSQKDIETLYHERHVLYSRYADTVIHVDEGMKIDDILDAIVEVMIQHTEEKQRKEERTRGKTDV